ncbi:MAG: murein biosynthesis integral membrane protein MurJ [Oceanicoccus sp.]|uniref:murein biosynthesis integral membrane protein MurJ n=1 Tax=Oceanicoccus sp. TaxID=2691044 RepID=UPI002616CA5C|nr:murein biosynthesis integral membrane protein MurJ [Oceanicoccus sp.]MDG1773487.1 murein biosynthesis integral membrane protein MurJ [Oceanicoccus sp.]
MSTSTSDQPQQKTGLLKSSLVVGMMTMLSRVLGLLRDVVIAHFVGATAAADAFFVAFKIPNFMRRLFAEGAFSQAFVPVLSEYREQRDFNAIQLLVNKVAGALGGSLLIVTGLAVVGAPVIAAIFAPGFFLSEDPLRYQLTSEMIRITFPYLFLISLTGFCGAVLNSYGRFAVPAFTPVLLNISLITAAIVIAPYFDEPAFALAWGVMAAGILQLTFQLPFMHGLRLTPKPAWDWQDEGVRRILALMGPAIFGVSVSQINLLLDTVLASFLPAGSVSWLYYSDRLVELPLGVFAIAISTVILPSLSRQQSSRSPEAFKATLDWAIRIVLLIAIPAAVALMILAEPILMTLFQYGKLTVRDVTMASYSLQAYSLGLMAFMLIKVLAPGYFSRQDTKTPVKIGIIAMAANMVMNVAFVVPLHYYWQLGHIGLALATSLSAFLNAGLLYRGLHQQQVYSPMAGMVAAILRLSAAAVVMAVLLWQLTPESSQWVDWLWWQRVLNIFYLCGVGAASYFVALGLFGARPRHFRADASTIA